MSTIQITKDWQLLPTSGKKLYKQTHCVICSKPKIPYVFDQNGPLVLRCTNCGHKSWA
ncbi:MAG TPA: hypothetical protein VNK25_01890 [Candidatus Nitrosotenuis sp.]|nr:hypothetical protein [Candidatus Nitrosotenuis sp.]